MVRLDGRPRERTFGPPYRSRYSDLTFVEERVEPDVIAEALLLEHYIEVGAQKQLTKRPDPDWAYYEAEYKADRLVFVTARNAHKQLRGYQVFAVYMHPHYKTVKVAHDDLHFLHSEYRGQHVGSEFLEFAEYTAAGRGATLFIQRHKAGLFDAEHRAIYERRGYRLTDYVYTKDLTNAPPPVG